MSADEILITGAAGFIGRHTVAAFQQAGHRVTALDLREGPARLKDTACWVRSDFGAPAILADVAAGRYQTVVHQGAVSDTRVTASPDLDETNTVAPLRLADACQRSGTQLIYASSHAVYGTIYGHAPITETADEDRTRCSGPLNAYAATKLQFDRHMRLRRDTGLDWIGLRYTNVFGPDEHDKGPMASIIFQLLRQAAEAGRIRLFDDSLTAARDYIPVEAVAATIVQLASQPVTPGIYNLGAGQAVSFAQITQWCARWHRETRSTPLELELIPNPVKSAYQYFTCADTGALDAELPDRPRLSAQDIEARAAELFRLFR